MKEQYVKNEKLEVIKKNWEGNVVKNNHFIELCDSIKNNWHGIKLIFKAIILPKFYKQKIFTKAESINDFFFDDKNDFMVWLGHSSFFIHMNGVSMITDPSFYDLPLIRREVKLPFDLNKFGKIDYVLISHLHSDHITKKSLKDIISVSENVEILTGLGMEKCLKKHSQIMHCAGWYQRYNTKKDVKIYFLPAMHNSGTNLLNMNKSLWGSFIIETPKKVIFFSGDTGYAEHFKEIKKLFPKIDCVLIELSWVEKIFVDGKFINGHLYPTQIKKILTLLNPNKVIPMHYGTFYKPLKIIPIEEFKKSTEKIGFSDKTTIPKIGEKIIL